MASKSAIAGDSLLEVVFGAAASGLCLVDDDGVIVQSNALWHAWARAHSAKGGAAATSESKGGIDDEVAPCAAMRDALASARQTGVAAPVARHEAAGSAWDGRVEPVAVDGARGLLLSVRNVASRADAPSHGHALDARARLDASELKLERSRVELLELIERLPIGVFVSRGGRVIYANRAFTTLLGYAEPAELVGMGPEQILAEEDHEAGRAYVQPTDRPTRALPAREWRAKRRDGNVVTLETSVTREIELGGQQAVLWTVRDLTELRVVQAQLMQADRLASVGVLAGGVGHEINNPLAFVMAAIEFVDETLTAFAPNLPPRTLSEITTALAEARAGASRVKDVVHELKSFARSEAERRVELDVRRVLDSSLSLAAFEIRHRARLVKAYDDVPTVLADEARLGQVFLNVVINAAHAIGRGVVDENEIRVVTRTGTGGDAIIEVHDTGAGIPDDLASRIFDPFFTTKPIGVGTGLGLSICRNVVQALGGDITFARAPLRGTVFRISLPAARPAAVTSTTTSTASAPEPTVRASGDVARRGRVLVVDDEVAVGNALRRIFASEHDVVALTSAREAHFRLQNGERFDVIVCDLMMPEMTGMELHAALVESGGDHAARMVFLTGGAFTEQAKAFLAAVTNERMDKPFDTAALRALVRARVRVGDA